MYTAKIKSIKKLGKVQTYDLHTPKHHNFLLDNGILSHNSGKSYRDLRKAELWYDYHFHEPFPKENICFGVVTIMKRLSSGDLRRGEILIFEEAGANLGSLDFQSKVSKMFTYVLQSFRSMNIAVFFNLPYFSMLNKQARQLMHYSFESSGIDFQKNTNKCKPLFNQVNQSTGKIYKKYLRVKVNGRIKKVKRMSFGLPSDEIRNAYEKKKVQYLSDLTEEYTKELEKIEEDKLKALGRPEMSDKQKEVYDLACNGLNQTQIAKKLGKTPSAVCDMMKTMKKNGYKVKIGENTKENEEMELQTE